MPKEWISRTMPWPIDGGSFPDKVVDVTPKILVTAYVLQSNQLSFSH